MPRASKNVEWLKNELPKLSLPCFNNFGIDNDRLEFIVTFTNAEKIYDFPPIAEPFSAASHRFSLLLACRADAQQNLEVRLATKVSLQPVYLTRLHNAAPRSDWRYPEELRASLAFDLANTGYSSLVVENDRYEEKSTGPIPSMNSTFRFWKQEKIPVRRRRSKSTQTNVFRNRFQHGKRHFQALPRYPDHFESRRGSPGDPPLGRCDSERSLRSRWSLFAADYFFPAELPIQLRADPNGSPISGSAISTA